MANEKKYRILIVDDHTLFRRGLRALIDSCERFEVVGEATDGLEGVKMQQQLQPDAVLLDLDMPVMRGLEALPQMMSHNPQQVVLMLTVSEDGGDLVECMRLGARGYLLKNIDTEFLLDSIEKAINGDSVLSPEMTSKLVTQLRRKEPVNHELKEPLTPREREILRWLARGNSNKLIARNLEVTESTVKVHMQNILRKLNLGSRVQAAVYAVEHGLDK
ncbi:MULTISPECIES: response regulator transcription factor [Snodgrassella]|uniref:response regulator n=1 Tax=Snodgrassella TaxID=1193515 RepID=UPI000C1F5690|nr:MULTISPECIES: response regulator transcription factor [Snodgrassella]MCX8746160.1 response regulator transcription factor [Snodgrassella sp. B3800]MCX8748038.1 response regulator transcription factor [Snodgrassella sp. B3088]PIT37563.1 DNA-binding response regulator [Snodgrassella alvi]PIT42799.1 DNA-binding response regulator [Snodgrassella alvi]